MDAITCIPELLVPLPKGKNTIHDLRGKVEAAIAAANIYADLGANTFADDVELENARAAFSVVTAPPDMDNPHPLTQRATLPLTSSAVVLHLQAMLEEYDHQIVANASTLRNYVTNKLIEESGNPDPKIRMKALELLGKVGDVGLFVERSEVTVTQKSTVELEEKVRGKLARLLDDADVSDAKIVESTPE